MLTRRIRHPFITDNALAINNVDGTSAHTLHAGHIIIKAAVLGEDLSVEIGQERIGNAPQTLGKGSLGMDAIYADTEDLSAVLLVVRVIVSEPRQF